jgi:hypothetical protein
VPADVTDRDNAATGVDHGRRPAFDGEALFLAAEHDVNSEVIELDTERRAGSRASRQAVLVETRYDLRPWS